MSCGCSANKAVGDPNGRSISSLRGLRGLKGIKGLAAISKRKPAKSYNAAKDCHWRTLTGRGAGGSDLHVCIRNASASKKSFKASKAKAPKKAAKKGGKKRSSVAQTPAQARASGKKHCVFTQNDKLFNCFKTREVAERMKKGKKGWTIKLSKV